MGRNFVFGCFVIFLLFFSPEIRYQSSDVSKKNPISVSRQAGLKLFVLRYNFESVPRTLIASAMIGKAYI